MAFNAFGAGAFFGLTSHGAGISMLNGVGTFDGICSFNAGLESEGAGADSFRAGVLAGDVDQGGAAVAIGEWAGKTRQGYGSVAMGRQAGEIDQLNYTVAVGNQAGETDQEANSVAVGMQAGRTNQGSSSVAVGVTAGYTTQGASSVAVGNGAGFTDQDDLSVAVGYFAGNIDQSYGSVAVGQQAGATTQGYQSVSVGKQAGETTQGNGSVAVGNQAGETLQGNTAVSIGNQAGLTSQSQDGIAIGRLAGSASQGGRGVAIGALAGRTSQGGDAVAVGPYAGNSNQGIDSVAIGYGAGANDQGDNGIIINSTGFYWNDTTDDHIHLRSPSGSLDFTTTGGWTGTDAAGTFSLRSTGGGGGTGTNLLLDAVTLGAIGDADLVGGGTDDTAAFQAMDDANPGRTIDLLGRYYNITDRENVCSTAVYVNGKTYDSSRTAQYQVREARLDSNFVSNYESLWIGDKVGSAHKAKSNRWSTGGATSSVGAGIDVMDNLTNGTLNIAYGDLIAPLMKLNRYSAFFGSNIANYQSNQWYWANQEGTNNPAWDELSSRNACFGVNTFRFSRHGYRNCIMGRNTGQNITAEVKWNGSAWQKLQAGNNDQFGIPTYKTDPMTGGDMGGHHIVAIGDGALSGFGPVGIDGVIKNDWPMFAPYQTVIGGLAGKFSSYEGNTLIGGQAGYQVAANQATAVGFQALAQLGGDMFWNGKSILTMTSKTCTFVTNTSNSRHLTITTPSGFPSMSAGYYVRLTGSSIRDLWMRVMSQSGNTLVVDTDGDATAANSLSNKTCYIASYASLSAAPISAGVTAIGDGSMQYSTYAHYCTSVGNNSMQNNRGQHNVGVGWRSLQANTTGTQNTAVGTDAMKNNNGMSNSTGIGYQASVTQSNQVQLGNSSVTKFTCAASPTIGSDIALKEDIVPSVGLDFINDLNPVQFHRRAEESDKTEHGIIAQELKAAVEEHCPDSGMVDEAGEYVGVRLTDLIAPLIKSVQELSEANAALVARVVELESK